MAVTVYIILVMYSSFVRNTIWAQKYWVVARLYSAENC